MHHSKENYFELQWAEKKRKLKKKTQTQKITFTKPKLCNSSSETVSTKVLGPGGKGPKSW